MDAPAVRLFRRDWTVPPFNPFNFGSARRGQRVADGLVYDVRAESHHIHEASVSAV